MILRKHRLAQGLLGTFAMGLFHPVELGSIAVLESAICDVAAMATVCQMLMENLEREERSTAEMKSLPSKLRVILHTGGTRRLSLCCI